MESQTIDYRCNIAEIAETLKDSVGHNYEVSTMSNYWANPKQISEKGSMPNEEVINVTKAYFADGLKQLEKISHRKYNFFGY